VNSYKGWCAKDDSSFETLANVRLSGGDWLRIPRAAGSLDSFAFAGEPHRVRTVGRNLNESFPLQFLDFVRRNVWRSPVGVYFSQVESRLLSCHGATVALESIFRQSTIAVRIRFTAAAAAR
jgi:hypothetical protein